MNTVAAGLRSLHLAAGVLLVGSFGFVTFVVHPVLRSLPSSRINDFFPQPLALLRLAGQCLIVLFASAVAVLGMQIMEVRGAATGPSSTLEMAISYLSSTRSGWIWSTRMGLLLIMAMQVFWMANSASGQRLTSCASAFVLSSGLLMLAALSGHTATGEGMALLRLACSDMLHLLACALWLGGLWLFSRLLGVCLSSGDTFAMTVGTAATRRFSALALGSVTILVMTGCINAWALIGGVAPLIGTTYGQLLLAKISLFLILLGLGTRNYLLGSKIVAAPAGLPEQPHVYFRQIRNNVRIEIALGLGVLLFVGHLGLTPPAGHAQPAWPFGFRWDWNLATGTPEAWNKLQNGIYCLAAGTVALLHAAFRSSWRIPATMLGTGLWILAGFVIFPSMSVDAYPTTYARPGIPYHADSIARGKSLYQASGCVTCHGPTGHGDGTVAALITPRPADLTADHANSHTAGDLFWWISYGVKGTAMPGTGNSLSEDERWDLINFLRALSDGERARDLSPVPEKKAWLIAPDFDYVTRAGEVNWLKELRGHFFVLVTLTGPDDADKRLQQFLTASPRFRAAGVRVIAVSPPGDPGANKAVALDGHTKSAQTMETYGLFARSFVDDRLLDTIPRAEFLIDKSGYIRARWLPHEGGAWDNLDELLGQVDLLAKEPQNAPAPDWHNH